MEGLTGGRMVHYVLAEHDPVKEGKAGEHRPALVIVDHSGEGTANLGVVLDGTNDVDVNIPAFREFFPLYWATSRRYSEEKEPGTWHWIERA